MRKKLAISIILILGFSTTAFGQWAQIGFKNTEIFGLGISPSHELFVGTQNGAFYSFDNGDNWKLMDAQSVIFNFRRDGLGFITGSGMYLTTDSGVVWKIMAVNDLVNTAPAVAFAPNGHIFASTNADGMPSMFVSMYGGNLWEALPGPQINDHIRSIAINKKGDIFAGGQEGMFRSTDDGNSWNKIDSGFKMASGLTEANITSVAINSKGILFATNLDLGVFRSSDNGDSWSWTMADTIWRHTEFVFNSICIDSSDRIFVGHNGGLPPVYIGGIAYSTNNGDTWNENDAGLGYNSIEVIAIDNKGYVFAGSQGQGLFRRAISELAVESPNQKSIVPSLSSFPNPFSQSTSIKFSTDKAGFARVSVLNLLGAEVAEVFAGEVEAGEHSVSWDARGMPAGMYLCMLRAAGRAEELPVMMVK
ncbi:MAG: hypothetical protein ACHQM6_03910 [Candidatus Kapaibacterium sp.]